MFCTIESCFNLSGARRNASWQPCGLDFLVSASHFFLFHAQPSRAFIAGCWCSACHWWLTFFPLLSSLFSYHRAEGQLPVSQTSHTFCQAPREGGQAKRKQRAWFLKSLWQIRQRGWGILTLPADGKEVLLDESNKDDTMSHSHPSLVRKWAGFLGPPLLAGVFIKIVTGSPSFHRFWMSLTLLDCKEKPLWSGSSPWSDFTWKLHPFNTVLLHLVHAASAESGFLVNMCPDHPPTHPLPPLLLHCRAHLCLKASLFWSPFES